MTASRMIYPIVAVLFLASQFVGTGLAKSHEADPDHMSNDCAVCVVTQAMDDDLDGLVPEIAPHEVFAHGQDRGQIVEHSVFMRAQSLVRVRAPPVNIV